MEFDDEGNEMVKVESPAKRVLALSDSDDDAEEMDHIQSASSSAKTDIRMAEVAAATRRPHVAVRAWVWVSSGCVGVVVDCGGVWRCMVVRRKLKRGALT